MSCYMVAVLESDVDPVSRAEVEAPPARELARAEEVVATAPHELFALSWRGREIHRVAPDAAQTELDGRPLVIGLCGLLGWGPRKAIPEGWQMCFECNKIAGGRT